MPVDAKGNQYTVQGSTVIITVPGPELSADLAAVDAAATALRSKVNANKAALDALALQAKEIANGTTPVPATLAGQGALLKKVCEMLARIWYNETFGDQ